MNVLEDIVSRGGDQSNITIVCVVACPPALKKLSERFPGMLNPIHVALQASICPHKEAYMGHGCDPHQDPYRDAYAAKKLSLCVGHDAGITGGAVIWLMPAYRLLLFTMHSFGASLHASANDLLNGSTANSHLLAMP